MFVFTFKKTTHPNCKPIEFVGTWVQFENKYPGVLVSKAEPLAEEE